MSDNKAPHTQAPGQAPDANISQDAATSAAGSPEPEASKAPAAPQPAPPSSGIAAAGASAGAKLNLGAQQQPPEQQQQQAPQPQQQPQAQPQAQPAQQQPAQQPQQPAQQQPAPQQPVQQQPAPAAAAAPAAPAPAAQPAAAQPAATQPAATQPAATRPAMHNVSEVAMEEQTFSLPDDGSAITFRREDRRAHCYFYVTLTFMVMMVATIFSGAPSATYLLTFPAWFVIIYFIADAIEMETAKLRLDLRRIQIVRWKNALTIPMCKITDLDIWPPNSRTKTGLDIYYKEGNQELRQRIRIQDFRDFDVIIALIQQGEQNKADFALDDKHRRANKIFRAKNYDKLILAGACCIITSGVHLQLMFGFAEFFRAIF